MKKITLLFLCLVGLYAETSFFLGFGGGYGTKAQISVEGKRITLDEKYNHAFQQDFAKAEGVIGFETLFTDFFGVRYYVNIAQGYLLGVGKNEALSNLEYGANVDLLFKIPVNEIFALRLYAGINTSAHSLKGTLIDSIQRVFDEEKGKIGNYEMGYTTGLKTASVNVGMHFLFLDSHAIEVGTKILVTGPSSIFYFRHTEDPNEKRSNLLYRLPEIEIAVKYIFIF